MMPSLSSIHPDRIYYDCILPESVGFDSVPSNMGTLMSRKTAAPRAGEQVLRIREEVAMNVELGILLCKRKRRCDPQNTMREDTRHDRRTMSSFSSRFAFDGPSWSWCDGENEHSSSESRRGDLRLPPDS